MTGVYKLKEVSCKRVDAPKLKRNGSLSTPRAMETMTDFEATDRLALSRDGTSPKNSENSIFLAIIIQLLIMYQDSQLGNYSLAREKLCQGTH